MFAPFGVQAVVGQAVEVPSLGSLGFPAFSASNTFVRGSNSLHHGHSPDTPCLFPICHVYLLLHASALMP